MLAGRKLLLADDSITIQKVVDLTFADEGVKVICVGNGREAIEKLNDTLPDVVLADVFMPEINGYQVCEHIKQNERLKHIPVMLLVGSFEPFDEAEARRVGADETLTKPFQSIRKLIDKVGGLMGSRQPEEEIATAELPKVGTDEEPEQLSTQELEITTADTQPLPPELESVSSAAATAKPDTAEVTEPQNMEPSISTPRNGSSASTEVADQLLDLGDLSVHDTVGEDFVLDLEFTDDEEPASVETSGTAYRAFVEPEVKEVREFDTAAYSELSPSHYEPISEQFATTQEIPAISEEPVAQVEEVQYDYVEKVPETPWIRVTDDTEAPTIAEPQTVASSGSSLEAGELSPEVIDAIARRVVERMSEKVVQEIAWEVVPQLAELMIKRQLEEKKS